MDLFSYFEKLELIAFFSAFPMFYVLVHFVSNDLNIKKRWVANMPKTMPLTYAIITLLYLGMKIHQMFEVHSLNLDWGNMLAYFKIWVVLGLLFFLPYFREKKSWSLLHSLPFTIIILVDFARFYNHQVSQDYIHNEMRLYFTSFMIAMSVFVFSSLVKTFVLKKASF